MTSVVLINPRFPHNVAATIRACSCFGVSQLWWTGSRVDPSQYDRLPREERMKGYSEVKWEHEERPFNLIGDAVPICVEIWYGSISLPHFNHPTNACYVFGPEDGSIPKVIRKLCHRFIHIPSRHCLNLAMAVNVVLYDRDTKLHPMASINPATYEKRGIEIPGWDGK